MTQTPIKVFLSSTSKDLGVFREAAAEAIIQHEMHPIMMERFPAASRDAIDVCEAQVAEANLFVSIYAKRYGYCPKNSEQSITEMEYHWAEAHGIDRLVFIFDAANAKLPPDDPIYLHADHHPRMQQFLNDVGKQVVWKTFTTTDDLKHQVYISIEAWRNRPARQRWFRSIRDIPGWAGVISLILLAVTLGIVGYSLTQLLRAGQESVALIMAVITLTGAIVPLLSFYWKQAQGLIANLPGINRLRPWRLMLLLQALVTVVVIVIALTLLRVAADDLLQDALAAPATDSARATLINAQNLGAEPAAALDAELVRALEAPNLQEAGERALALAYLYMEFVPEEALQERAATLEASIRTAVQDGSGAQVQQLVRVLAVLDPASAGAIARDFYDRALEAYATQPPDINRAEVYMNAFLAAQTFVDTGLSPAEISYASQLHGTILEVSDPTAAFDAYRHAIATDADNLEAYYLLSSGLLVQAENSDDPATLTEAINVARNGYTQGRIDPTFCRDIQNLDDDSNFRKSWHCFLLMTTEAGARTLRASSEDTHSTIVGLLERAINLAETNDHFGDQHFTAEAYYWLARNTQPDPETDEGLELYCQIIQQLDRSRPRHITWLAYANESLDGRFCVPG